MKKIPKSLLIRNCYRVVSAFLISLLLSCIGIGALVNQSFSNTWTSSLGTAESLRLYYYLSSTINDRHIGRSVSQDVIIVDAGSISRGNIGKCIDIISEKEPTGIGIDLYFRAPRNHQEDSLLIKSLEKNKCRIVLPVYIADNNSLEYSFFQENLSDFETGFINIYDEYKRFKLIESLSIGKLESIEKCLVEKHTGKNLCIDKIQSGLINYFDFGFRIIDSNDVLEGSIDYNLFKDKIVLLGAPNDVKDVHETYAGPISGTIIHGNIIQQLLSGRHIHEINALLNWLICLLLFGGMTSLTILLKQYSVRFSRIMQFALQFLFMVLLLFIGAIFMRYCRVYLDVFPYFLIFSVYSVIELIKPTK